MPDENKKTPIDTPQQWHQGDTNPKPADKPPARMQERYPVQEAPFGVGARLDPRYACYPG